MARQQMASVIARYNTFIAQLEAAGPEAVEDALRPIFDKSQEYVPVDTGTLAESGVLDVQKQGNGKVLGTIEYGNQAAWYAALVHEMVWLNHTPPTRAKYLQAALEEEMDNIMTSVLLFYSGAFK